jgi:hypothetical protein
LKPGELLCTKALYARCMHGAEKVAAALVLIGGAFAAR